MCSVTILSTRSGSEFEFTTQVSSSYLFIREDAFSAAGGYNMPLADDKCLFTDIQCIADIMIGNQYTDASIAQVTDDFFYVVD